MSQANDNRVSKRALWVVSIILVVVSAIGAGLFTYSSISPRMVTSVSTTVVTNTSIITNTQTSTSYSTLTSLTTSTALPGNPYAVNCYNYNCQNSCNNSNSNVCQITVTPSCYNSAYQAPCYANSCYYNGQSPYYCGYNYNNCYYGQQYYYSNPPYYNNNLCQSPSSSNSTVECSGYLHQDQNGCIELAVPFLAPWLETQAYQYYTLYNLPSSYPPSGSWVTVIGQLHQGYYAGSYPYGSVCPGNSITVSAIS